jgi:hypothetical protein
MGKGSKVTNVVNFCAALREMSANFMRVTRGAGKPEELVAQAMAIVAGYEELRASGLVPNAEDIRAALAITRPNGSAFVPAQEGFIEASLQIAAARQDRNRMQERAGEKDMLAAVQAHDYLITEGKL